MKREAVGVETFLNTFSDINDGLAAQRSPVISRQMI
jgi:hypothetical protein